MRGVLRAAPGRIVKWQMHTKRSAKLSFADYFRILIRRLPIIIAVVVVDRAAVLSFLLSGHQGVPGTATLLLQPKATESLFNPNTGVSGGSCRAVQTEIQVLKSGPVREAVRKELGAAPEIGASPVGQTDVIEVSAISTVPKDAATVANAYARAYIDFRRKQAVDDLFAAGKELQLKIDQLNAQLTAPGASTPAKEAAVNQIALFKERLNQLQVDAALKTGGAQFVTPAEVPTTPVRP